MAGDGSPTEVPIGGALPNAEGGGNAAADKVGSLQVGSVRSAIQNDWEHPLNKAYLSPEDKAEHPKIIQDPAEAEEVGRASILARSREALERQTARTKGSGLREGSVEDREDVLKRERAKLAEMKEGTDDYASKRALIASLEVNLERARADRSKGILSREDLGQVYTRNTDRRDYNYDRDRDRKQEQKDYAEIGERQEMWAQALHRNPEAAGDWTVSTLIVQEDDIYYQRERADDIAEAAEFLKALDGFDVITGLNELRNIDDRSLVAEVDKAVKAVLRDKTKTVAEVDEAFFGALDLKVKSVRELADKHEATLNKMLADANLPPLEEPTDIGE